MLRGVPGLTISGNALFDCCINIIFLVLQTPKMLATWKSS